MSYRIYRETTLGRTLQDTIDYMIHCQQIPPTMGAKILLQFDKSMHSAFEKSMKTKMTFKGKLTTYRFCDNVWNCIVSEVDFKDSSDTLHTNKLRIVACDAKEASVSGLRD